MLKAFSIAIQITFPFSNPWRSKVFIAANLEKKLLIDFQEVVALPELFIFQAHLLFEIEMK